MANVKFNKHTFEKEIGKLTLDMQEKIALFGTPVEAIHEQEVEIEIFPNRPDLLSYYGFKRSFLSFLGKNTGLKKYKISPPEKDYQVNSVRKAIEAGVNSIIALPTGGGKSICILKLCHAMADKKVVVSLRNAH